MACRSADDLVIDGSAATKVWEPERGKLGIHRNFVNWRKIVIKYRI
jgi:hypothetical protein